MKKSDGKCQVNVACGHPKNMAKYSYWLENGQPHFSEIFFGAEGFMQFYAPNKTAVLCCDECRAEIMEIEDRITNGNPR